MLVRLKHDIFQWRNRGCDGGPGPWRAVEQRRPGRCRQGCKARSGHLWGGKKFRCGHFGQGMDLWSDTAILDEAGRREPAILDESGTSEATILDEAGSSDAAILDEARSSGVSEAACGANEGLTAQTHNKAAATTSREDAKGRISGTNTSWTTGLGTTIEAAMIPGGYGLAAIFRVSSGLPALLQAGSALTNTELTTLRVGHADFSLRYTAPSQKILEESSSPTMSGYPTQANVKSINFCTDPQGP